MALLTMLLIGAGLIVTTGSAGAATPGLNANITLNGNTYNGTDVVTEGDVLKLSVQYSDAVEPGSTAVFEFSENVAVTDIPSGNEAIESIQQDGNTLSITFKDPWPVGVNQGVFTIDLTVKDVEHSSTDVISWKLDGEETKLEVIIRDRGDEFENVSPRTAKGVSPGNLNSYVVIDEATGKVSLKPEILDQDLTYTLDVDSKDPRPGFELSDTLPAGFAYQAGSFAATITTWDADGLNKVTNPFPEFAPTVSGGSFTDTFDLPGPSRLVATYKVRIDGQAGIDALEQLLQDAYDARQGAAGDFSIGRTNVARFDGVERSATVTLRGTIRGVNIGNAFAKNRTGWETTIVDVDENGTLLEPIDAEWTLRADLRQWTGENPNFVLGRNVVIVDTLPAQASWKTGDPDVITASGIAGVSDLTNAGTCPATVDEFQGDANVGSYCVGGQKVMINVGKNAATNATITLRSQLNTTEDLPKAGAGTTTGSTRYEFRNDAAFHYRDGGAYNRSASRFPVVLPESDEGYNDETVFSKTGDVKQAVVAPGATVEVDYRFVVGAGKGIDARTSHIVDHLDRDLFDLDDPADAGISGTYDGQPLTVDDFEVGFDEDDNLVIALSGSGRAVVDARGADKAWIVDIHLVTKPFEGKETKEIFNRAVLRGEDEEPLYWSESESESTSYGSEAEVAKRVYDRTSERWVSEIREYMDGEGNLAERTQFYRIEFKPHGSYNNVEIVPVDDVLPDAIEFLGFVDGDIVPDATGATTDTIDIGGNLEASYDAATRTVTISQKNGTKLDASQTPIMAHFAVEVTDASAPIINVAGGSETIIEPVPSVWVGDYVWVDSNRDGLQDDGEPGIPGVTLVLVGPDGESVTDVFGNPVEPTVTDDNGWYTFGNLPVLEGDQTYTVLIDRDASEDALRPYVPTLDEVGDDRTIDSSTWEASTVPGELHEDGDNDPTLDFGFVTKSYAIGDYVWIDKNRDGIQDADEPVLPGVKVELLDEDGTVLDETTTDAQGRYLFDGLDAGTYRVRFTLTDAQAKLYLFTEDLAGDDTAVDSDADPETGLSGPIVLDDDNPDLTGEYDREFEATQGVDPTWDAGVIRKSVSVGDHVWVDENRDGLQDEGEPGIPGVTLCLIGPDGEPVVDVFGNPVGPTVTDENGWYTFENLPSLDGDETYTVCIDREASEDALRPYVPTLHEVGGDRTIDSSTWEASTLPGDLQENGDRDPTLDFGFVTKSYAIGDYVWIDKNRDGIQDADEPVLPGVKVELLDEDGTVLDETATDAEGRYLFDGLPAGTYQVRFTLTDAQAKKYRFTSQNSGSDTAVDSDADPSTGLTTTIVLDDSNTSLTGEYDREFDATQGIDPTWDAGVVEIPDEQPPGGDVIDDNAGKQDPSGSGSGILARTGSDVRTATIVGLSLLALGGLGLGLRRRRPA